MLAQPTQLRLTPTLVALSLVVASACVEPGATEPLSVLETVPAAQATNVSVSAFVQARLTRPLPADAVAGFVTLRSGAHEVSGVVTADEAERTVTFTPAEPLERGTEYQASVRVDPEHRWTFTTTTQTTQEPPSSFLALQNFQGGSLVVGQADFTTGTPPQAAGASRLVGAWGDPAYVDGTLYLPDGDAHRVLGFNGLPETTGTAADFALGQSDLTSGSKGTTSGAKFLFPQSVFSDGRKLTLTDWDNNRVLIWNNLPRQFGVPAATVVGQTELTTRAHACTRTSLNGPEAAILANGKLVVSDNLNHRILIWNTVPASHGAPADLVLGQRNFTHCARNDQDGDGAEDTPAASTLASPAGLWSDGTRLVVADSQNHRVLIWTTFPTANAQPADRVLGQLAFDARVMATGAGGLSFPYAVSSNGTQLFVADRGNNRVLVWEALPAGQGASASNVLGQENFSLSAPNDDNHDGAPDARPSPRTLNGPRGLRLIGDSLWVNDGDNFRFVVFR